MAHPQTVKVASDNPAHAGGFVIINQADFDPVKHQLFGEESPAIEVNQEEQGEKLTPPKRGRPAKAKA